MGNQHSSLQRSTFARAVRLIYVKTIRWDHNPTSVELFNRLSEKFAGFALSVMAIVIALYVVTPKEFIETLQSAANAWIAGFVIGTAFLRILLSLMFLLLFFRLLEFFKLKIRRCKGLTMIFFMFPLALLVFSSMAFSGVPLWGYMGEAVHSVREYSELCAIGAGALGLAFFVMWLCGQVGLAIGKLFPRDAAELRAQNAFNLGIALASAALATESVWVFLDLSGASDLMNRSLFALLNVAILAALYLGSRSSTRLRRSWRNGAPLLASPPKTGGHHPSEDKPLHHRHLSSHAAQHGARSGSTSD